MPSHYLNQCWDIVNWTLRNKFSENLIGIHTFSFKKIHLKMSSAKWRPFWLGLNVLNALNISFRPQCVQLVNSLSFPQRVNTMRPRQNGCYFPDDIFKCIFLNENVWISIKISLKFVPKRAINNILALVQIMAWHCPGDKPLSELMMFTLPFTGTTYSCVGMYHAVTGQVDVIPDDEGHKCIPSIVAFR